MRNGLSERLVPGTEDTEASRSQGVEAVVFSESRHFSQLRCFFVAPYLQTLPTTPITSLQFNSNYPLTDRYDP